MHNSRSLRLQSLTFHQHVTTGLIKAANQLGIEHVFAEGVTLDSTLNEISNWAARIANTPDRPDGYIFLGEASYFAAMNAFRKCGLERRRDFNVVVKRNSELISHIDPGVSVVFEDIVLAGQKMAEILLDQVGAAPSPVTQYIDVPDRVGRS